MFYVMKYVLQSDKNIGACIYYFKITKLNIIVYLKKKFLLIIKHFIKHFPNSHWY